MAVKLNKRAPSLANRDIHPEFNSVCLGFADIVSPIDCGEFPLRIGPLLRRRIPILEKEGAVYGILVVGDRGPLNWDFPLYWNKDIRPRDYVKL